MQSKRSCTTKPALWYVKMPQYKDKLVYFLILLKLLILILLLHVEVLCLCLFSCLQVLKKLSTSSSQRHFVRMKITDRTTRLLVIVLIFFLVAETPMASAILKHWISTDLEILDFLVGTQSLPETRTQSLGLYWCTLGSALGS